MTELTRRIVAIIGAVPAGKVVSYGQVAELCEHKGSARQVSWTLRTQTNQYNLPWHRVIGASGKISLKNESGALQRERLESEGVEVNNKMMIDLNIYGWHPTPDIVDGILRKS